VERKFIAALIFYVSRRINTRYRKPALPRNFVLLSIIFNDTTIDVSDDVMGAVSLSLITSQPALPPPQSLNVAASLIPKSSFFMLWNAARNEPDPDDDATELARPLLNCFDAVVGFINGTISGTSSYSSGKKLGADKGDSLELIYRQWLLLRLQAAQSAAMIGLESIGGTKITLARMLGLRRQLLTALPGSVTTSLWPLFHSTLISHGRNMLTTRLDATTYDAPESAVSQLKETYCRCVTYILPFEGTATSTTSINTMSSTA
jgi:hypothetical protein